MGYNSNRLQFVHCDTCFENSSKAREYVSGELIANNRPALYAEPMILKYGNPENPNILLAIGSVGDGKTQSVNNKVFFIDCAKLDIDNNFNFFNTNTISFTIEKHENGTDIHSDILLQPTKIVDNIQYDNIILNEENGLFTYVDVKIEDSELVVIINGEKQNYQLPDSIVEGKFNTETFELILNTRKNQQHIIPFKMVSDNLNNIIKKNNDGLYASVDINYDKSTNILSFNNGVEEKEFDLLSTVQDNINKTVDDELKRLNLSTTDTKTIQFIYQKTDDGTNIASNVKLQSDVNNLLVETEDGLYASINLSYNSNENLLTLTTTQGQQTVALSNHTLVNSIYYDSASKKIIFVVDTALNGKETFEIPLTDLFNEWDVENNPTQSPIILEKTVAEGNGVDTLKAFLNVSSSDENLIQIQSDGSTANLFASNQADAIKIKWYSVDENGDVITDKEVENVQQALVKVVNFFDNTTNAIQTLDEEMVHAKERITTLETQLSELTDIVNNMTDFGYTD